MAVTHARLFLTSFIHDLVSNIILSAQVYKGGAQGDSYVTLRTGQKRHGRHSLPDDCILDLARYQENDSRF